MPPLGIMIKPASSLCNMRCGYCFYADVSDHRQIYSYGVMTEETLETLVEKALHFATGQCSFVFQGGEPTLAGLDFFKRLIALEKKYDQKRAAIYNSIQTNGLVIDEEWARFLAENRFLVGLSIDGDAAAHDALRVDAKGEGTFRRVWRAARLLKKHGCEYNALCVVTGYTARHAVQIYNALKEHRYLQFIPCIEGFDGEMNPYVLTDEAYGAFLNTTFELYYRDYMAGSYVSIRQFDNYVQMLLGGEPENCAMRGVCTCNLIVEGDGSCYPCDFYVLDDWRLGNIKTEDIAQLLSCDKGKAFVAGSLSAAPECADCQFRSLCRGGCRRDREKMLGADLQLNRFCKAYKQFFDKNLDRLVEIARMERRGRPNSRQGN